MDGFAEKPDLHLGLGQLGRIQKLFRSRRQPQPPGLEVATRQICNPVTWAGIAVLAAAPALAGQAWAGRSQADIARALRSHDRDTVAHALGAVPFGFDPEDELGWKFVPGYVVTPELSAALISALDREARVHLDGCTPTGIGGRHLELSLELEHAVIALRDPATIPALVQVICSGGGVRQALMRFGPVMIPHVVEWARSPDAAWADVAGSLLALSRAVERWEGTLASETRASIKDVALLYLGGPAPKRFDASLESPYVIGKAITLASVMRDPDLLGILEDISEGDHEALGSVHPNMAPDLKNMAREGLSGPVWAMPRPARMPRRPRCDAGIIHGLPPPPVPAMPRWRPAVPPRPRRSSQRWRRPAPPAPPGARGWPGRRLPPAPPA